MKVWVGALGRYPILGCACNFLGCFSSACTNVHAFEKNGRKTSIFGPMWTWVFHIKWKYFLERDILGKPLIYEFCMPKPPHLSQTPLGRVLWPLENGPQFFLPKKRLKFPKKTHFFCPVSGTFLTKIPIFPGNGFFQTRAHVCKRLQNTQKYCFCTPRPS